MHKTLSLITVSLIGGGLGTFDTCHSEESQETTEAPQLRDVDPQGMSGPQGLCRMLILNHTLVFTELLSDSWSPECSRRCCEQAANFRGLVRAPTGNWQRRVRGDYEAQGSGQWSPRGQTASILTREPREGREAFSISWISCSPNTLR